MATILVYGATGHTGRLIAERAAAAGDGHRYVLAARRADAVRALAARWRLDWRAFALDDVEAVRSGLRGVQLVINAAGPFALTALRLAKSAIREGVHYVDICGEVEAYLELRSLRALAVHQQVGLVCGAAQTPGVSNLLLEQALSQRGDGSALREVRIGLTRPRALSGGSLQTLFGSVQDRVVVARPSGTLRTVPVGRLQHRFRFGAKGSPTCSASAASLLDTVAAGDCLEAHRCEAESVVSYLEAGPWERLGADLGALAEPLRVMPGMQALNQTLAPMLSTVSAAPRDGGERHAVIVELEDRERSQVHCGLHTPEVYRSSATLALCAAAAVLAHDDLRGWVHPGLALSKTPAPAEQWLGAPDWRPLV